MKAQIIDKRWWVVALWSTAGIIAGLALGVLTAIIISDFQWHLFPQIMSIWWLAFIIIIAVVDMIIVLITKFPLQTISITLLAISFVFMLASAHDATGQELRSIISEYVELNYLVASITVFAFWVTFVTIYQTRRKKADRPEIQD